MQDEQYIIYGLQQSYFTRMTQAYFDYKGLPYRMRLMNPARMEECGKEGWPRGIPPVRTPDGTLMWDSTSMMLYLETVQPEPSILHPDPTQQFLAYVIEDYTQEWLVRHAACTRWYLEENAVANRWAIGREFSHGVEWTWDQAGTWVNDLIAGLVQPLGVTEETAPLWIADLWEWMTIMQPVLAARPYLLGDRPCIADFAVAGACLAHFGNDPACFRKLEELAPAVVKHMERLREPREQTFGDWCAADDVPDALIALLQKIGREYLPWVVDAVAAGEAANATLGGTSFPVGLFPPTAPGRDIMVARYQAARSDALDAILERADILQYFAGHASSLDAPPSYDSPPRPTVN